MILPTEIALFISYFAVNINDHRNICSAFGILCDKKHSWIYFWNHLSFPTPSLDDNGFIKWEHRVNGPDMISTFMGNLGWLNNKDRAHRNVRPSIAWIAGDKEWIRNGMRHRDNGPAVIRFDDHRILEWWRNGVVINVEFG